MKTLLILAPLLVGVALASYDPYMNLDKWYQMQLLANAINDYLPSEQQIAPEEAALEDEEDPYAYWPQFEEMVQAQEAAEGDNVKDDAEQSIYNDPMTYSEAHPRDEEHLEHSNLHGHQSMTGGTAEGAQNEKQVKSDKLPAYCNPPNPCPLGKTAAENCVENFENTAENNERLLAQQECSCDTEHMFKCPAGSKTVSAKAQDAADSQQQMVLNKVMGDLAKMEQQESLESNPNKRFTVVAKKSPLIRKKRSEKPYFEENPYLKGDMIAIAAKKNYMDARKRFPQQKMFEI